MLPDNDVYNYHIWQLDLDLAQKISNSSTSNPIIVKALVVMNNANINLWLSQTTKEDWRIEDSKLYFKHHLYIPEEAQHQLDMVGFFTPFIHSKKTIGGWECPLSYNDLSQIALHVNPPKSTHTPLSQDSHTWPLNPQPHSPLSPWMLYLDFRFLTVLTQSWSLLTMALQRG